MKDSVTVIIPAYNEELAIGDTIDGLKSTGLVETILVIDDGSKDRTGNIAKEHGAKVIKLETNMGKGHALNLGVKIANTEIIAFVDADLGMSSSEIKKLIVPVAEGRADVAIAQFPPAKRKGGFGLVKRLARHTVKRFAGAEINACLSGQRVFRKEVLDSIGPIPGGYAAEVGINIRVLKKGFRIEEVPVFMTHHETGRDIRGFIHRGKQFVDIIKLYIEAGVGKWLF
ncbi:MAG: Glycosyltransferases involved in cell wall biogenesis [Firmicutes bacterium]|nr:Glycosyltransferases involved in cell wall biogenesis [Bacillota bacterium]